MKSATAPGRKPAATCATCGGPLPNGERQFCDDCLPDERRQLEMSFSAAGVAALVGLIEGETPAATARVSAVGARPVAL